MRRPPLPLPGKADEQGPAAGEQQASASIRPARPADASALARLLGVAFPEMDWPAERARTALLDAPDVTATFVVEEDGALLATASCRHVDDRFPSLGYVHWVAVDPKARGRGLFDLVMGSVMERFKADGRPIAVLETDDKRLPAIAAYLRLGFVPQYTEPDHEERWSRIFTALAAGRRNSGNRK